MQEIRIRLENDPELHDYWQRCWVEPIYDTQHRARRLVLEAYRGEFKRHPLFGYTPIYIKAWGGYYANRKYHDIGSNMGWWSVEYKREIYVAVEGVPFHLMDVTEAVWNQKLLPD